MWRAPFVAALAIFGSQGEWSGSDQGTVTATDERVARGFEALAGAFFSFERAGNPAAALAIAQSLARARQPALRAQGLVLEARAALLGGDFARARSTARQVQKLRIADRDRQVMGMVETVSDCLIQLGGDGSGIGELLEERGSKACLDRAFALARKAPPNLQRLFMQGGLVASAVGRYVMFSSGGVPETEYQKFSPLVRAGACGERGDCAVGAILEARMVGSAGRHETAQGILNEALTKFGSSAVGLGLLRTAKGDLHGAPHGFPEELDLAPSTTTPADQGLMAGHRARAEIARRGGDVTEAKRWWQLARVALQGADCPRCLVDLDVRGAYLDYLSGKLAAAHEGFSAARRAYLGLGDRRAADRLLFPLIALGLADQRDRETSVLVKETLHGLKKSGALAEGANLVGWLGRFSRRENLGGDGSLAIRAARVGGALAEALRLPTDHWQLRGQEADLLSQYGLELEATAVLRKLLASPVPPAANSLLASGRTSLAVHKAFDTLCGLAASTGQDDLSREMQTFVSTQRGTRGPVCEAAEFYTMMNQQETSGRANPFDEAVILAKARKNPLFEVMARARRYRHHCPRHDRERAQLRDKEEAGRLLAAARSEALDRLKKGLQPAGPEGSIGSSLPPPSEGGVPKEYYDRTRRALDLQVFRSQLSQIVALQATLFEFEEAARTVQMAEPHFPAGVLSDWARPWREHDLRAEIAEGRGLLDEADNEYRKAVELIERLRPEVSAITYKEDLSDDNSRTYHNRTRLLIKRALAGKLPPQVPLFFLEGWRARRLNGQISQMALIQDVRELALTAQIRELQANIEAKRRDLARALPSSPDSLELARSLDDSEKRLATVATNDVRKRTSAERSPDGAIVAGALKDRLRLSEGVALISYFVDRDLAVAWVWRAPQEITLVKLPTSRDELTSLRKELFTRIQLQDPRWAEPAAKLHERLLAPLQRALPQRDRPGGRLGIVPYSVLHGIPFQALVLKDRPVISDYLVFYAPSIRAYAEARLESARRPATGPVTAFGFDYEDLAHAESEARSIAGPSQRFVGSGATRRAFQKQVQTANILHVAGHAEANPDNPFRSFIRLADGPLELWELSKLAPRRAKLVTLSACETGRAATTVGQESTALSTAILAAGVPSAVVSLWRVDDRETSTLMGRLYSGLREGDPATALGLAQRRAHEEGVHPFYWAAFALLGADQ
jgi:CHAT domain-containing protein